MALDRPASPTTPESQSGVYESDAKRRKLRKGTNSCWACKKRKVRCTFASSSDATCINCSRRGTTCVGQEVPELEAEHSSVQIGDRIVRVEELLNKLVHKSQNGPTSSSENAGNRTLSPQTPFSDGGSTLCQTQSANSQAAEFQREVPITAETPTNPQYLGSLHAQNPRAFWQSEVFHAAPKYEHLSKTLNAAFPSQKDMEFFCSTGLETLLFFENCNSNTPKDFNHGREQFTAKYSQMPTLDTHPVLLAHRLLIYTMYLQQLPLSEAAHLSEPRLVILGRMMNATRLVTTDEELLGTLEGLECVMLEGICQANWGNLRKAWLITRKAIALAQLMGIDRPNAASPKAISPNSKVDTSFVWFKLTYVESFFCLLLGLPKGGNYAGLERSIPWLDNTPTGRLERVHARVAARLTERNQNDPLLQDIAVTRGLDAELLNAAKNMPAEFWLPANFASLKPNSMEACLEAKRLMLQLFHYNLLNQVHLPFLIHNIEACHCDYSTITAVTSSREILTRFVTFQSFNQVAICCRVGVFIAIMAGMTLLLAHLYRHRHNGEHNILAHQRFGDRAMMDQVLENMELISKLNEDVLTDKSAALLRQLLKIEEEASAGNSYLAETVTDDNPEDGRTVLKLALPYFGMIKISGIGMASSRQQASLTSAQEQNATGQTVSGVVDPEHGPNSFLVLDAPTLSVVPQHTPINLSDGVLELEQSQGQLEQEKQSLLPSYAAGLDDWTFQGVDTAFFDALMKGPTMNGLSESEGLGDYQFNF